MLYHNERYNGGKRKRNTGETLSTIRTTAFVFSFRSRHLRSLVFFYNRYFFWQIRFKKYAEINNFKLTFFKRVYFAKFSEIYLTLDKMIIYKEMVELFR